MLLLLIVLFPAVVSATGWNSFNESVSYCKCEPSADPIEDYTLFVAIPKIIRDNIKQGPSFAVTSIGVDLWIEGFLSVHDTE